MEQTLSTMNVQAEKLELISWLAALEDLKLLERFKELKQNADMEAYESSLKPMTREALTLEIEESMAEYERGEYVTLEESSKDAASW